MTSKNLGRTDITLLDPFWEEAIERQVLPNGLTLIVKPDASVQLASVQFWVKTGSIHEGPWLGSGLSHFLEHMMFKGTARRSGRAISAEIQAAGGYLNAYTTFDRTVYYVDLPSEKVGLALEVLADAVLGSVLPEEEFERERQVILREIAMTRDDPDQRLGEMLFETAFRSHPYRHPIIGSRNLFEGLKREDLLEYYRTRYVPNNGVLVVVGAVEPAVLRQEAERWFGSYPRARLAPVWVPGEEVQLAPRSLHRQESVDLTRAALAWQIPGLTHPDAPLLDVAALLLGAGDSSVLWQEVREKARLVHSIDAQCWNPGSSGLFYLSFTCEPEKRELATQRVEQEVRKLASEGVTEALVRKAVRQLVVGEINTRKTMAGQAARLGAAEVVAGDLHFSQGYFDRLRTVRPAEVGRVLREHLLPTRLTQVSTSPAGTAVQATRKAMAQSGPGDFELVSLSNGARLVYCRDTRLPNLHMRLLAQGGPLQETPSGRGASALLATLLTKDTLRHEAAEIARYIESAGGSFSAFCGNNSLGFALEVLPTDERRAVRVLGEALLQPALLKSTFEVEREAQLAELRQDADEIATVGRKRIRELFFEGYPLAYDANGTQEGVRQLRRRDLQQLKNRVLQAQGVVLAVAGAFSPDKLLPKLGDLLGKLQTGPGYPAPVSFIPGPTGEWRETLAREQAVVFEAYPGPSLLDPDYYVGEVADELFSGMASRLFERVREEKGLAYFVRSSRVTGLAAGLFQFFAGTAPTSVDKVFAEFDAEIARVAQGDVGENEIQRCHARLQAARRQSLQSNGAKALNAGLNALFSLPINDWKNYDARVAAIGVRDLARFAQRFLRKEVRRRLVIGP